MKHITLFATILSGCSTYYPTRRAYNGCDRAMDYINYHGGPIFLLILLMIAFILIRFVVMKRRK